MFGGREIDTSARGRGHSAAALRVIAGVLGGRRLVAPRGARTRPTSDRVREAVFMALEPLLDLRVVDLFAGSGALGIEALSRGAAHVDFVEPDRAALGALRRNLEDLELRSRAKVWPLRLPQGLRRIERSLAAADLVLLDPPYGGDPARRALEALGRPRALKLGCRVVLEHHAKDPVPDRSGALERTGLRRYGETLVSRFEPRAAEGPPLEEPGT